MDNLFSSITLLNINQPLFRNIVSLTEPDQNPFDDLSDNESDWSLALTVASDMNPMGYSSFEPEIYRAFEEAEWFNAILWPFRNWQASRFSKGSFGVWHGSDAIETTVYETVFHWLCGFLTDAGLENESVISRRQLFTVSCRAGILDFRPAVRICPQLLNKSDYSFTQSIGSRIHREGHPGLVTFSARLSGGLNFALLNSAVLSEPKHHKSLTYRLQNGIIKVEEPSGTGLMEIPADHF
jgi:hypothetical protein